MPSSSKPSREISRVPRSKQAARLAYDSLSRWYDALSGTEKRFVDAGVDKLSLATGERVLEIGYGTGHALLRMAHAVGASGVVDGIDLSEGMRAVAQRRVARAGCSDRVRLTAGDATALPYDSACMDAVFMSFTLELLDTPEIPVVLRECSRVLAPEGRICVVAMAGEEPPGLALRMYEWAHQRFPAAVDCRPIPLKDCLEEAHFRVVTANRQQMWGLPLDTCVAVK